MARSVEISIVVDADGAVKGVRNARGQFVRLGGTLDDVSGKASRFGKVMDVAVGNIVADAVPRLIDGVRRTASAALALGQTYEQQLADLSAITGIAGEDLEDLGQTAIDESVRTGVAAREQIEAYKLLASNIDIATAGGVEGLKRLGRETVLLAQAAGVDLARAADTVAGAINQFQLPAEESARVVNVLAAGAKEGAAEIPDLSDALVNVGASASGANVSIEETTGALEVLAQNNLKGARAGTQLRNVLTILQTETAKLAEKGIQGLSIEQEGLAASLGKLRPLLGDAAALTEIFGRENVNAARTLIQSAGAVEEMTEKVTGTNTAAEQAAKQINTLRGDIGKLYAAVRAIALDGYARYEDELRAVVQQTREAVQWIRENGNTISNTLKVLTALTVGFTTFNATMRLSAAQVAAWNVVTRSASLATAAWTLATKAARRGMQLFNATIRANPIGAVLTVLTTAATAFLLFRDNSEEATGALRAQRREVQGLTDDLERLGGAQLFQREMRIETNIGEVDRQLDAIGEQLSSIYADPRDREFTVTLADGTEETLSRAEALKRLRQDLNALSDKRRGLEDALVSVQEKGIDNLLYRRAQLQREVDLMAEQGEQTDELKHKREELAAVEEKIQALRSGPTPDPDPDGDLTSDEIAAIREREFERREAEIAAMKGGREKKMAAIDLEIDRQIERARQKYAADYPAFFDDMQRLLNGERAQLKIDALPAPEIEPFEPEDIELPEIDLELSGSFIDVGGEIHLAEESIRAVDAALADLQQQFDAATTQTERDEIQALIDKLREMRGAMQASGQQALDLGPVLEQGLADAIGSVIEAVATGDSVARALLGTIAQLAMRVGKMMIAFGVSGLALQNLITNPVTAIVAGGALLALGAAAKAAVGSAVDGATGGGQSREPEYQDRVPSFQKGVTDFEGGLARVHAGELLVNLPSGTNVLTNENTQRLTRNREALRAGMSLATSPAALRAAQGTAGTGALLSELKATREAFARKQFVLRGADLETQQARQRGIYDDAGIK